REIARARLVLVRVLSRVLPHGDDRDVVGALAQVAHGRRRDNEAAEHDRASAARSDDALRPRARSLHDAPAFQIEMLDRRRRAADDEARDGAAVHLAGAGGIRSGPLRRPRLLDVVAPARLDPAGVYGAHTPGTAPTMGWSSGVIS